MQAVDGRGEFMSHAWTQSGVKVVTAALQVISDKKRAVDSSGYVFWSSGDEGEFSEDGKSYRKRYDAGSGGCGGIQDNVCGPL